jgi:2-polyprenyl-3-methyl-5-hydroxy-6-metoxy-1,4-benzoquinol methylase
MRADSQDVASDRIIDLYERRAGDYDRDRGRSLQEREWLARFLALVEPGGAVLDIGCGMGEPIARHLIDSGVAVTGIDSSASLIALCRTRFPGHEWIVADMRQLALGRRFHGLIAWDSFFHLSTDDQRAMFARFAAHARPGAPLLFTSGPSEGEAIGDYHGEPLFHASLGPAEYEALLLRHGFTVRAFVPDDPRCGGHTVWLATYGA